MPAMDCLNVSSNVAAVASATQQQQRYVRRRTANIADPVRRRLPAAVGHSPFRHSIDQPHVRIAR